MIPSRSQIWHKRGALPPSVEPSHLLFRLLQPEPHAHLAVHRRRDGEMFFGLRVVARASVEVAEAKVAVGDEGTHAEFLAERQRLTVVVRTLRASGWSGCISISASRYSPSGRA